MSIVSCARKRQTDRKARNASAGSALQMRTSSSSASWSCSASSASGTRTVVRSPASTGKRFCSSSARTNGTRSGGMNATRRCVASSTTRLPSTVASGTDSHSQLSSVGRSCRTSSTAARTRRGPAVSTPCACSMFRNDSSRIQRVIVRRSRPMARPVSVYDLPSRIMRAASARLYGDVRFTPSGSLAGRGCRERPCSARRRTAARCPRA